MVHTADIVSEHTLEAVSLITTLNPTSPQQLLHKHKYTHTSTANCHPSLHRLPTIFQLTQPLVSSYQPIPHMLLFRISCGKSQIMLSHTETTDKILTLPHLDIMQCRHPPHTTYTRPIIFPTVAPLGIKAATY